MVYPGSKRGIAKYILPIILSGREEGQWYVEPFCGGANTLDKVGGKRIGSDVDWYLIAMFKAIQRGWNPPETVTREDYYEIKKNQDNYDPPVVWFTSVSCSFGAKRWGGYAQNNSGRNYAQTAIKNIQKQVPFVKDVLFVCNEYDKLRFPSGSILYCDPPYKGTIGYGGGFDHERFWEWCRIVAYQGHNIFISEIEAPDDFTVLWEKTISTRMKKNDMSVKRTER